MYILYRKGCKKTRRHHILTMMSGTLFRFGSNAMATKWTHEALEKTSDSNSIFLLLNICNPPKISCFFLKSLSGPCKLPVSEADLISKCNQVVLQRQKSEVKTPKVLHQSVGCLKVHQPSGLRKLLGFVGIEKTHQN